MSKINKSSCQKKTGVKTKGVDDGDFMAAMGREEQEKGRRWAEALSSVKALKVNRVSVKLTPMFPPFESNARVM